MKPSASFKTLRRPKRLGYVGSGRLRRPGPRNGVAGWIPARVSANSGRHDRMWLRLAIKNVGRKPLRSVLTASSVAVSMFLLVVLLAAYRFLSAPAGGRDRTHLLLVVSPRTSMMMTMPIAYQAQIAGLPGVAAVSPFGYFGAHYGARDSFIPAMAFDPEQVFAFFRRWKLPASERRAFIRERTALIAGRTLAEKFGWKVGDRIHLTATMNRHLGLDFTVQGLYDAPPGSGTGTAVFHWNYMNEA